jgi:regulator of protease activity HflC (stomatin/prohibitin superfamily)
VFNTVLLIVMLVATVVALVIGVKFKAQAKAIAEDPAVSRYDQRDARTGYITAFSISGGLAVMLLFLGWISCVTVIGATEVGVPIAFGKVGEPMNPGFHVVAPWKSVETYPTRPKTVELSGDETIIARTADAGQMRVEVAVRWKVDPSRAKDLYLQVRTGDDERISNDVVEKNLRQAVNEVYSRTANLDAINDRQQMAADIQAQLNEQLERYGIGIEDVNIRSVEPDEKTADTISQYARQQQATRIAEEAKRTAEIEAQRRLIEAEGLRTAADTLKDVTPGEAEILCQQAWERQQAKATDAGQNLYTTPCGSGSSVGILAK